MLLVTIIFPLRLSYTKYTTQLYCIASKSFPIYNSKNLNSANCLRIALCFTSILKQSHAAIQLPWTHSFTLLCLAAWAFISFFGSSSHILARFTKNLHDQIALEQTSPSTIDIIKNHLKKI